jgi:hypothetical protein
MSMLYVKNAVAVAARLLLIILKAVIIYTLVLTQICINLKTIVLDLAQFIRHYWKIDQRGKTTF